MRFRSWGQFYIQPTPPDALPVIVGSLWFDLSTNLLKKCVSTYPVYVYTAIEGEGAGGGVPADSVEALDGIGDAGDLLTYSRGDHKHADSNRPTDTEKAALAGTDGSPGDTNRYVTDSDARLDNLGDVIGPSESTDNAIARYRGTSGAYIQNSNVVIEDNGDMIGKSFVGTRSGTVNRTEGQITSIALTGGRTITIYRTGGYVSSVSDGTRTWTIQRDNNNNITGWTVI